MAEHTGTLWHCDRCGRPRNDGQPCPGDDVKPFSAEQLNEFEAELNAGYRPADTKKFNETVRRLLATARAGLEDQERLEADPVPREVSQALLDYNDQNQAVLHDARERRQMRHALRVFLKERRAAIDVARNKETESSGRGDRSDG